MRTTQQTVTNLTANQKSELPNVLSHLSERRGRYTAIYQNESRTSLKCSFVALRVNARMSVSMSRFPASSLVGCVANECELHCVGEYFAQHTHAAGRPSNPSMAQARAAKRAEMSPSIRQHGKVSNTRSRKQKQFVSKLFTRRLAPGLL
jgi:hypothetical protein